MPLPQRAAALLLGISSLSLVMFGIGARTLVELAQDHTVGMTSAHVSRVIDSTTIEVRLEEGTTERVRLLGIAAVACYERPALSRLTDLAKGRQALLELPDDSRDRSGRLFGYIWLNGMMVNEQLVAEGFAVPIEISPAAHHHDELEEASAFARERGLGLWSHCGPSDAPERSTEPTSSESTAPEPVAHISSDPSGPRRVSPISTWECPATHRIKAGVSEDGERVYTRPNRRSGPRLKPLDCFATEADARQAGYHHAGD